MPELPGCPIPHNDESRILLAHGGGGTMMQRLLHTVFFPAFANPALAAHHDSAVLDLGPVKIAFTTDSYVVHPLIFPGGDIGMLAVNGTINDLAMSGARPLYLSAGFILEEGLAMATLLQITDSMRQAAASAGVQLVTGDTKVVDRGKGDGMFITTAGIGLVQHELEIAPHRVRPGDAILLNGDLGRHGMAIMAVREGLGFETPIVSDCAPLAEVVLRLLDAGLHIHCLRDLTRGGLASALGEIAQAGHVQCALDEAAIPVCEAVQGACEMLGLDPLYVANEGRFVCFVPAEEAALALDVLQQHPLGTAACCIGSVTAAAPGLVTLRSHFGSTRIVDMLSGEQLPRIC